MSVMSNVGGGGSVNVRYDDSTDYVQIKYNGTWTNWKKAYLQFDGTIYDNGTWAVDYDNTGYASESAYTSDGGVTLNASSMSFTAPASGLKSKCVTTDEPIDLTDWNSLNIIYNGSTYSLDLSSISGSYYLVISLTRTSSSTYYMQMQASTTKQYYATNRVGVCSIVHNSSSSSDITQPITKWWLAV